MWPVLRFFADTNLHSNAMISLFDRIDPELADFVRRDKQKRAAVRALKRAAKKRRVKAATAHTRRSKVG